MGYNITREIRAAWCDAEMTLRTTGSVGDAAAAELLCNAWSREWVDDFTFHNCDRIARAAFLCATAPASRCAGDAPRPPGPRSCCPFRSVLTTFCQETRP